MLSFVLFIFVVGSARVSCFGFPSSLVWVSYASLASMVGLAVGVVYFGFGLFCLGRHVH